MPSRRWFAAASLCLFAALAAPQLHASVLTYESHSAAARAHYTLLARDASIVLVDDATGRTLASAPAASTTRVVVRGAAGAHDDTLTVDVSARLRLAEGLDYDGGAEGWDTLVLRGDTGAAQRVQQLSSSAGIIDVPAVTIRYDNLEPLTDTGSTANLTFSATSAAEEINVVDGPVVSSTQTTEINSGASGTFELLDFANKTNVTVNTNGGSDIVTVNIPNPAAGLAALAIQGDTAAERFNVTPSASVPITVTGGAPLPPGTGDVLNVNLSGTTGQALSVASDANGLQGAFTFSNRQSVTFAQVETLNPTDLRVRKLAPFEINPGTEAGYVLIVENLGPSDAANVVLTDNVTAPLRFVSITQTSGPPFTCTGPAVGGTGTVSCSGPVLLSGTSAQFSLRVNTPPNLPAGVVSNTASVTSGTSETFPSNNTDTVGPTPIVVRADLVLTKTAAETVAPNSPLVYSIAITNDGPADASMAMITDNLPAGATFASIVQTAGPTFSCTTPPVGATGTVTCTLATMLVGVSASFQLTVTSSPTPGTVLINEAIASASTPQFGNRNIAVAITQVTSADLVITKTADAPVVASGGTITYRIIVRNNGPTRATNVTVTDVLPPGTTLVSASPSGGSCSGTTTITCSFGTLNPTNGEQFGVQLDVTAPSSGPVINTATVSSSESDPVPANNSATSTVAVLGGTGTAIPTLSEWMLYVLGAALALFALAKIR